MSAAPTPGVTSASTALSAGHGTPAAQFATAAGFTVTWTRSADGTVRELGLAAPVDATDAARAGVEITANAISDATVVFPTEAIGPGARWTVTHQVDDAALHDARVPAAVRRIEVG